MTQKPVLRVEVCARGKVPWPLRPPSSRGYHGTLGTVVGSAGHLITWSIHTVRPRRSQLDKGESQERPTQETHSARPPETEGKRDKPSFFFFVYFYGSMVRVYSRRKTRKKRNNKQEAFLGYKAVEDARTSKPTRKVNAAFCCCCCCRHWT